MSWSLSSAGSRSRTFSVKGRAMIRSRTLGMRYSIAAVLTSGRAGWMETTAVEAYWASVERPNRTLGAAVNAKTRMASTGYALKARAIAVVLLTTFIGTRVSRFPAGRAVLSDGSVAGRQPLRAALGRSRPYGFWGTGAVGGRLMQAAQDRVTVVVPARNEAAHIRACLDSLVTQDWDDLEILVVDGASEDATAAIVAEYAAVDDRITVLHNQERVIPISLNMALRHATGRWLVRVDAHATVPRSYVRTAVGLLSSGEYGGVGGRKDGVGRTAAGRAIAAVMRSRFGVGGSTYHFGTKPHDAEHVPFGAYPVALLRELEGWDERLRVNQDFELDYRVRQSGRRIRFDPRLRIEWECRQSITDLYQQYRRYGEGKVVVAAMHPRSLRLRHLAAPAFVLCGVAGVVGTATGRDRLAAAALVPYATALGAASVVTANQVDRPARWYVVPAFLAMHVGWGLGFWRGVGRLVLAGPGGLPAQRRSGRP